VHAPNEQAAFNQAYHTMMITALNYEVKFRDDAKFGVISFGVGDLQTSIIF